MHEPEQIEVGVLDLVPVLHEVKSSSRHFELVPVFVEAAHEEGDEADEYLEESADVGEQVVDFADSPVKNSYVFTHGNRRSTYERRGWSKIRIFTQKLFDTANPGSVLYLIIRKRNKTFVGVNLIR